MLPISKLQFYGGNCTKLSQCLPIRLMGISYGSGTCCSGRVTRWAVPHDQDASASHIACTWRAFASTYPYLQHYHKRGLSHPSANPGPTLSSRQGLHPLQVPPLSAQLMPQCPEAPGPNPITTYTVAIGCCHSVAYGLT